MKTKTIVLAGVLVAATGVGVYFLLKDKNKTTLNPTDKNTSDVQSKATIDNPQIEPDVKVDDVQKAIEGILNAELTYWPLPISVGMFKMLKKSKQEELLTSSGYDWNDINKFL